MTNPLTVRSWSPYWVGGGIGVLSWFAFLTVNQPLGITTPFEHTAALAFKAILPSVADSNSYFRAETPKIGWEWMLVCGVLLGALLSAKLSGDYQPSYVPHLWQRRFGRSTLRRFGGAFLGGAIMMFGARLAKGCTSGHGISGNLQLDAASYLFTAIFFGVAVLTALLLYGKEKKHV